MKIIEENAGLLSNNEVLAVLKDREADQQAVVSRALPSEIEVYTALLERTPAVKSREELAQFIEALKPYALSKQELLHLINARPQTEVELYTGIDGLYDRFEHDQAAELLELVKKHLS